MNAPDPAAVLATSLPAATPRCPRRPSARRPPPGGFALVVALLIISLLVVVAVSFLSSSASERQTSDAYTAKARAEQAAQAAVDSATAMLSQSFRDFPDSATVWDPQQSFNVSSPNGQESGTTVTGSANEGTTLYLRAVPKSTTVNGSTVTVADAKYTGAATLANDPAGNNPNNPACKTFELPLISGVVGGYAQLASDVRAASGGARPALPAFDLSEMDPSKQTDPKKTYCTDLNVRRFQGDKQGVIGSPPDWAPDPNAKTPLGPKPARALWVNLKGSDGLVTGRYAFWIEDESFRSNINLLGDHPQGRPDNTANVTDGTSAHVPRALQPSDASLEAPLAVFGYADTYAAGLLSLRAFYPGGFMPERLAHSHATVDGTNPYPTAVTDALRYLATTQSGALNLTRHGTERLNLNTTVTTVALGDPQGQSTMQKQVSQIVKTLQFHLPNLGQRFYRTTSDIQNATLNATQVKPITSVGDPAVIYDYKVAANLRDYIDTDSQPTIVMAGGNVPSIPPPSPAAGGTFPQPFGDEGANAVWAQGKEAAPFLQETAVRYRPVVKPGSGHYSLKVDYYLEFWNMTDKDIYASPPQIQTNPPQAHMNGAVIGVTDQMSWAAYPSGTLLTSDTGIPPVNKQTDFVMNLTGGVYKSINNQLVAQPNGVVFAAGKATVITTDPDFATYTFSGCTRLNSGAKATTVYTSLSGYPNADTTFYCSDIGGKPREFSGPLLGKDNGIEPVFRDANQQQDYGTEVSLYNSYGWLDCFPFASAAGGGAIYTSTDTYVGTSGLYNDYGYGGSLFGNSTYSQMGDPRTNNEQMVYHRITGVTGDQSRYYNGYHTLGYPDGNYVQPLGGSIRPYNEPASVSTPAFIAWPDYYNWDNNTTAYTNPDQTTAPAVIADAPLTSIGQLGDVFDPARLQGSSSSFPEVARGGGRTFKIGQRDDRFTYDSSTNPTANNTIDSVSASNGWAAWRLADVFSIDTPIELPGRLNINGVQRDGGAAFRALLSNFIFQPTTTANASSYDPLLHGTVNLAAKPLDNDPGIAYGVTKIISQMIARLKAVPSAGASTNVPWGPFFERGEFGELQNAPNGQTANPLFGQNAASPFTKSGDLVNNQDMDRTFDRGREEVFRRIAELICTRGDTFTVYVVGQSILQAPNQPATTPFKINGTQRMRVTFRMVPKGADGTLFTPAYNPKSDGSIDSLKDFPPTDAGVAARFSRPTRYDAQILEVTNF